MTIVDKKAGKADEVLWQKVLDVLEKKVAQTTFNPWMLSLKPMQPLNEPNKDNVLTDTDNILTLSSDQAFGIQVLQKKYLNDISDAIFEVTGVRHKIELVFQPSDVKKTKKRVQPSEQTVLMEKQIEQLKQMHSFCGLNLKYTFDNFVVGENSKFAYTAARTVAEAPGQKYNPLFIYGSVGIGKTHLMQAIGHYVMTNFSNLKIKYTKAEEFMNQLIDCLKMGGDTNARMKKFRDMYRNVDILLIDDIQFIEGKKRTEEEIFNTFDTLFHAGKQIVFASDRPISAFAQTPERLKSRYEWGLSVDITVPDYETRVAIVEHHATRSGFEIKRDVSEFLASIYDKNVRELEGAYNRVSAWASIKGETLTVEKAKEILGCALTSKKITPNDIIEASAKYFGLEVKEITGAGRSKEISTARQVAIYLAREITELSFPALAKDFKKNHTTILYCWEKVKKEIKTNVVLLEQIKEIEKEIHS